MNTTPIADMSKEEWDEYRMALSEEVRQIHIPSDVNPKMAISILSKIDHIYSNIRLQFSHLESTVERIDSKVKEVERISLQGKNEDDRKRNAVLEVRKIATEGGFTLYDVQRESLERHLVIKGILDVLINKQNRLITINGLLKLDKDLLVSSDAFTFMNNTK